jgi:hypothetical protein
VRPRNLVQFSRSLRCAPQPRSNFRKTAVWAHDARRVRDHTTNTTTSGLHLLSCSASLQCNFTLFARSLARFSSYIIMDSDFATSLLARCGLHVDVESRALICRRCKYALATANSQVTTHLDKKHRVPKELRSGLTRCLRQHLHEFRDPCSLSIRPHGSVPQYHIQSFTCMKALPAASATSIRLASNG